MEISQEYQKYFLELNKKADLAYDIAERAKIKHYDPENIVEIPRAKNMAERVEGLVSAVAPQIIKSGIVDRLVNLEKEYGKGDWRVGFKISLEVAQEKFCKFKDKHEAMEVGLRIGLAFLTNGVLASPLEGFTQLKIKKRRDGKEYFCLFFSGPIRSAGTTATCVFVCIADYIRKKMGYEKYDPDENEIKRVVTELYDYHEKVTNLQYLPTEEEAYFMIKNLPIQIDGDPTERFEVSNYKNIDRIETNKIRGGVCLVFGEGLTQKAAKFYGRFSKWMVEIEMDDWNFIEEFIKIQKRIKAKDKKTEDNQKIKMDYTFIKDIVAGRPVITYPLRVGGLRLRYGRGRNTGLSSTAIHPATMIVLNGFIAIGSQFKMERPGKGCVVGVCDSIEGPIVKLKNGDVIFLDTEEEAIKHKDQVKEILFLGDILINYGDFFNRAHVLVPSGYCEEWYVKELLSKASVEEIVKKSGLSENLINMLIKYPSYTKISFNEAYSLSKLFDIPLHPRFTYHWKDLEKGNVSDLLNFLKKVVVNNEEDKLIVPYNDDKNGKRILEVLGIPHKFVTKEYVVIEGDFAKALMLNLNFLQKDFDYDVLLGRLELSHDTLEFINKLSEIKIKDKSGICIGARMGRPEKAKVRKLTGTPQILFPVGSEGGKFRSFQSTMEFGKITGDFPINYCNKCDSETIYFVCDKCDTMAEKRYYCKECNRTMKEEKCKYHDKNAIYKNQTIDINRYIENAKKKLNIKEIPDLIKGVRGTSNEEHIPEHLVKGILRAFHNLPVNKDGTIRYDMTEAGLTHFKPIEIGTDIKKLKELGYEKDIYGNELNDGNQILELKIQDVVLPASTESGDEGADIILSRIANFIDDLLNGLYGVERFYNLKKKEDLVGHLIISLAPHISAGVVGRIIGFSRTQGGYAHPLWHSAQRRDCLYRGNLINVYDGLKWQSVPIGEFVESFNPIKEVDEFGTRVASLNNYSTITLNKITGRTEIKKILEVSKHLNTKLIKIDFENGRILTLTPNHKVYVKTLSGIQKKAAYLLGKEDLVITPFNINIPSKDIKKIDTLNLNVHNLMIRNIKKPKVQWNKKYGNFIARNSYPISFFKENKINLPKNSFVGIKRDHIDIPRFIKLTPDLLYCIGLYIAEGYARKNDSKKGFYQINFSAEEQFIRDRIMNTFKREFSLYPSQITEESIIYSSRLLYSLFVDYLGCGTRALEKKIPAILLSLPKKRIKYLLQGYFDGDGSVSLSDNRITCDTISEILLENLYFVFARFGIYIKRYKYSKKPGPLVRKFYERKGREIPTFTITKVTIPSNFTKKFYNEIGFSLPRKQIILKQIASQKFNGTKIKLDEKNAYLKIKSIKELNADTTYCLNVEENHNFIAGDIAVSNCDGDECGFMLLLDGLLNFSRKFLPAHRGATQDSPLVLTTNIIASEVDDMVFDMDIVFEYPLEFYEACEQYKMPWDIKIDQLKNRLGTEKQYEGYGFTHHTTNLNFGVRCSAYKFLPTMMEKVRGQMELAEKIRAVDENDVARLVIERHFIRDIRGNLRKFSMQEFRCVNCNAKYRRPPLIGRCLKCDGKIIFTISEGSIIKYLEPSFELARRYVLPSYLQQSLELTKSRIESLFGREDEKQEGLTKWF